MFRQGDKHRKKNVILDIHRRLRFYDHSRNFNVASFRYLIKEVKLRLKVKWFVDRCRIPKCHRNWVKKSSRLARCSVHLSQFDEVRIAQSAWFQWKKIFRFERFSEIFSSSRRSSHVSTIVCSCADLSSITPLDTREWKWRKLCWSILANTCSRAIEHFIQRATRRGKLWTICATLSRFLCLRRPAVALCSWIFGDSCLRLRARC